jgi:hypothetical protein
LAGPAKARQAHPSGDRCHQCRRGVQNRGRHPRRGAIYRRTSFEYLLTTAQIESNLNPAAQATNLVGEAPARRWAAKSKRRATARSASLTAHQFLW